MKFKLILLSVVLFAVFTWAEARAVLLSVKTLQTYHITGPGFPTIAVKAYSRFGAIIAANFTVWTEQEWKECQSCSLGPTGILTYKSPPTGDCYVIEFKPDGSRAEHLEHPCGNKVGKDK